MKKVVIGILSLLLMAQGFCDDFESHIHFDSTPTVGMIKLDDRSEAISQSTWIYVNTALNHYKQTKPAAIILELNSPGGEVFAAERISDALKDMDTQHGIPIICYIDNWAISAGAMLAYSCRYIVCSKDASMGAAEPVIMGQGGTMEAASEKMNSALRTDFANHAKFFDRNPYIAEAMVDKDIILVSRDGKIIKLDSEDEIKKDSPRDIIISPKGKLLTLNTDQLLEYGIANMSFTPEKLGELSIEEQESGTYPLSKTALNQIPYFQKIGDISVHEFKLNWQTKFLAILASPAVSSILFMVLMISIYMELSTGGFGVAGAVALISVFLVGISSFALEAVHVLEPLLLGFGLILVALEVFFFPTLGILGVIGAIFMLMGLAGIMLPGLDSVSYENNTLNAAGEYVFTRLTWLSGAFLLSLAIIGFLSRYMWPKLGISKFLILSDDKQSAAALEGNLPKSQVTELPLVGTCAQVSAALRPAGKVMVGDTEYDAVSTGSFLDEGTNVQVVRIEGSKVVVEEQY